MRKDYMPVPAAERHFDEARFIEEFWTKNWAARTRALPAATHVERREEFRVMDPYVRRLPCGARLLDGGCGLGEWTAYYAARGFETHGLDISRATIEQLKRRFPDRTFTVGDIRSTGLPDASFDAYFSWGTFEHFEEGLSACFREAARILKPWGWLFVSVPYDNPHQRRRDQRPLWRADAQSDPRLGYAAPMRFYQWRLTRAEFQREFELHGFRLERMQPIARDTGVHRALKDDWGLPPGSPLYRLAFPLLRRIVPKRYVGHMLIGAGQKREGAS